MQPSVSVFGNVFFILIYLAFLSLPILFAFWIIRSVNRLVESVLGMQQDLGRIAKAIEARPHRPEQT